MGWFVTHVLGPAADAPAVLVQFLAGHPGVLAGAMATTTVLMAAALRGTR